MKSEYFGLRGGWLCAWITIACGADMTLYGYDQARHPSYIFQDEPSNICLQQGVFSGVVISQDFLRIHNLDSPSKTTLLGTTAAIYDVGCCAGSLLAVWLGDFLGRKRAILFGTLVMTIGALLQCCSYSLEQMMVGRIISGIGNGTSPQWLP